MLTGTALVLISYRLHAVFKYDDPKRELALGMLSVPQS